jgi:O-acetyl-ADP-ribose deacetylase
VPPHRRSRTDPALPPDPGSCPSSPGASRARCDRGPRLLEAAAADGWDVDTRPHLAYWLAPARDRLYTNPQPWMTVEEYVARWAGPDGQMIGSHRLDTVVDELWPWLLERGYATDQDTELLEPFLERVRKRKRDAHIRPGLRLMRRWSPEAVAELDRTGELADQIREAVNELLVAVGDPALPAR